MTQSHIPRKRFGQHFLIDHNVIARIVKVIHPKPEETLVEIGAGTGALTKMIINHVNHLYVVEIDRDLVEKLTSHFSANVLTVFEKDALHFDFAQLATSEKKLRIFGNLPYNISTPLLFHLLTFAHSIENMIFMLQKEVVERICAKPGHHEYGRLSIMVQYACQAQMLFDIGPKAFSPPPKVNSSILWLKPYHDENRPYPIAHHFDTFAQIVATAFQHRRKTLKNALQSLVPAEIITQAAIDLTRRPETLSISEYVHLSNLFANYHQNA